MRFINPKTDFAFKRIFGSTQSKAILISFLNALVYQGEPNVQDLEILDPYQPPRVTGLKDTYLDVKATLQDGSLVIIEMQVLNVNAFHKRVIYNAAKAYSLQLQVGESYWQLKPVIALTLTDFVLFEKSDGPISSFCLQEENRHVPYPDNELRFVFVELPKFEKTLETLETLTDKWIYFMKSALTLDAIPTEVADVPEIQQAFQIADRINLTPQELEDLEKREMYIYDQQGALLLAAAEGEKRGEERGAQNKAIEIALQLLPLLDDAQISAIAGLSLEEVRSLRQQNN